MSACVRFESPMIAEFMEVPMDGVQVTRAGVAVAGRCTAGVYIRGMSDGSRPGPTEQDPADHDPTALSEGELEDVAGGLSIFDTFNGWPRCSHCGQKHDPKDWSCGNS